MSTMSGDEISIGELARQLKDVVTRLEGVMRRLDNGQFVRTDVFNRYEESVVSKISKLERDTDDKAAKSEFNQLAVRVSKLEDEKTWITRLVISFIILAVLGIVFSTTGMRA
jgi:hypothetical protein